MILQCTVVLALGSSNKKSNVSRWISDVVHWYSNLFCMQNGMLGLGCLWIFNSGIPKTLQNCKYWKPCCKLSMMCKILYWNLVIPVLDIKNLSNRISEPCIRFLINCGTLYLISTCKQDFRSSEPCISCKNYKTGFRNPVLDLK